MKKTLDELNLSPAPIHPARPADDRETDWWQFSREIDQLLAEIGNWGRDTLIGIQNTVETSMRVTEAQRQAVRNITRGHRESRQGRRVGGAGTSRASKGW